MAMHRTLDTGSRKPSLFHAPQFPAIVCVGAILLICLYSGLAIQRLIASNAPPFVTFTLGTAYRDVTYCNSQTLDVFIPSVAPTRPLPLAIFVHGAGLIGGAKGYLNPTFLNALATAGVAVASVNYRLAPHSKWPAQIEDVKCAIRYLRHNAGTYGINPGEVFAFGTSFGGLLVSLTALTAHQPVFDAGPYLNESSALLAAVDMFGPADLPGWISDSEIQLVFGGNRAELVTASPVHYITAQAPPILIVQGTDDTSVPESQSVEFYDRLVAAGDQTQLIPVHNMGHMWAHVGSQPIDPSLTQIAAEMVRWFERYGAGS